MWAQIVTHMLTAWHHHVYATLQILVGIVGGGGANLSYTVNIIQ